MLEVRDAKFHVVCYFAPVVRQVRGARLYARRPVCVELTAEGLT